MDEDTVGTAADMEAEDWAGMAADSGDTVVGMAVDVDSEAMVAEDSAVATDENTVLVWEVAITDRFMTRSIGPSD